MLRLELNVSLKRLALVEEQVALNVAIFDKIVATLFRHSGYKFATMSAFRQRLTRKIPNFYLLLQALAINRVFFEIETENCYRH